MKGLGFVGGLINGTTEGRFLDHASYDGLLTAAVDLDVPIYIHPHLAPEPVRQAYYFDLPPGAARVIEQGGWGWHSETAARSTTLTRPTPRAAPSSTASRSRPPTWRSSPTATPTRC